MRAALQRAGHLLGRYTATETEVSGVRPSAERGSTRWGLSVLFHRALDIAGGTVMLRPPAFGIDGSPGRSACVYGHVLGEVLRIRACGGGRARSWPYSAPWASTTRWGSATCRTAGDSRSSWASATRLRHPLRALGPHAAHRATVLRTGSVGHHRHDHRHARRPLRVAGGPWSPPMTPSSRPRRPRPCRPRAKTRNGPFGHPKAAGEGPVGHQKTCSTRVRAAKIAPTTRRAATNGGRRRS